MKIIAYILSVYILVLTAIPCIDAPDNIMHTTEQTQTSNHDHEAGADHCSPFCTCQCCATPVVIQNFVIEFSCYTFSQPYFSGYNNSYIPSLYTAIWQPPKIC